MTGVFVNNMSMPCSCLECPFSDKITEIPVGDSTYKKISRCIFSDNYDISDPWHEVSWLARHREDWCPLIEVKKTCNTFDVFKELADVSQRTADELSKLFELINHAEQLQTYKELADGNED